MDRYKRSISKKNKIYCPYTILGIGNFYFFSPGTGWYDYAYHIFPDGEVSVNSYYITRSYEYIQSPRTDWNDIVFCAYPSGDVGINVGYVIDSYGCIYNRRSRGATSVHGT